MLWVNVFFKRNRSIQSLSRGIHLTLLVQMSMRVFSNNVEEAVFNLAEDAQKCRAVDGEG